MDKTKQRSTDYILLLLVIFFVCFGIIMVFSSSFVLSTNQFGNGFVYFKRQLTYAILGFIFMFIFYRINYMQLKILSFPILFFSILLLLLTFVPQFGVEVGGARRWLNIGNIQIQPSEIAKLSIIIYLASVISQRLNYLKSFKEGILPYAFIIGIICLIIARQKSLSTIIIIGCTFFFLLLIAGAKIKHLLALFTIFLFVGGLLILKEPYRIKRVQGYLSQDKNERCTNYQIQQSLIALGVGGLKGVGIAQSRQKFLFLPHPHTDFIFSIIGEELGIIGAFSVIFFFIIFAWRGFKISLSCNNYFGFLLAAGITFQITFQAMINLGVSSGCLPVTGVPLPFVSYGGSSLVVTLSSVGILLSISRQESK